MSVRPDELTGHGYALSLTVKDCPASPDDWRKVRKVFLERLRRMGLVRLHWLTEWQARKVPHMHAAVWFDAPQDRARILQHWLEVTSAYRSGASSQYCAEITGSVGWFEYLAKHAARSVANYQRSPESIPPEWQGVTGRMWGHVGAWPVAEAKEVDVPPGVWWRYRRLMVRYQVAKARRQGDRQRVRYLTQYRQSAPHETSAAQALPRFWISEDDQWTLLACAMGCRDV